MPRTRTYYAPAPTHVPTIHQGLPIGPHAHLTLLTGATAQLLPQLPAHSVNLIMTSPPYNTGQAYEQSHHLQDYLTDMQAVIAECTRVVTPDGSICWQVGTYVHKGEVFPLDMFFYPLFRAAGYVLRKRIIWHFGHGLHAKRRFSGRHETLLWFTRGDAFTSHMDQPHDPWGRIPPDLWRVLTQQWEECVWDIPNVKGNHREKTEHPCQFPIEIPERCIVALTNPGDLVLDPFCGAGSTLLAALMRERRALGIDHTAHYIATTRQRVQTWQDGQLPYRPMGMPVQPPVPTHASAQVPQE